MPTKQELETINDDLLAENSQLRRDGSEQTARLEALTGNLQQIAARLEALASRPPASATGSQTDSSRDELAAQIEPLVTGLKQMIERAKSETIDQNKHAQILQTMLERNERTSSEFTNSIRQADIQTDRLSNYLNKWQGQPRMTMWKVTGAMFLSTILAGLLIAFLVQWSLSPTRQLIEDASKWRALTQAMTPEQVRQIESRLNQSEQSTGASAPTTNANSAPMISSPTPPANGRSRR
jgi:DNA-binding ferritin-like protein